MLYAWIENGLIFAVERLEDVPQQYRDSVVVFKDLTTNDVSKLYIDNNEIKLKPEESLKEEKISAIKNHLIEKVKAILNGKLSDYGYYSFGDLIFYAQNGEKEANELLAWYKDFDKAVWDFIENDLPNKSLTELNTFSVDEFISSIER